MISRGRAMRGGPGDLDSAAEVGEEALRTWVAGSRPWERLNHEHMLGEQYYWTGRIADGNALMTSGSRSGTDPQSIQTPLRSAALMAHILCSTDPSEVTLKLF